MNPKRRRVARAWNDTYYNEDGSCHIDMFSANGTVILGHSNELVTKVLHEQLDLAWNTGVLDSSIRAQATAMVEKLFPSTHGLSGFYTTGMEAAEFAIRHVRVTTGRKGIVGFWKSMHGKSLATAYLAWENPYAPTLPDFYRLPYPCGGHEDAVLSGLRELLEQEEIAAVFVEPIQGSSGGHMASSDFWNEAYSLCQKSGTLLVFDEILTGIYRTGTLFFHSELGFIPDIVLIGKTISNGFPVSAVIANKQYPVEAAMLPGSTYAGNPLAAAAVVGTLQALPKVPLSKNINHIEEMIVNKLTSVTGAGIPLRGKGALWILELPTPSDALEIADAIYKRGILAIHAGPFLRMMPTATITPENLETACNVIREVILDHVNRDSRIKSR